MYSVCVAFLCELSVRMRVRTWECTILNCTLYQNDDGTDDEKESRLSFER